jgi:hypothetical protein
MTVPFLLHAKTQLLRHDLDTASMTDAELRRDRLWNVAKTVGAVAALGAVTFAMPDMIKGEENPIIRSAANVASYLVMARSVYVGSLSFVKAHDAHAALSPFEQPDPLPVLDDIAA